MKMQSFPHLLFSLGCVECEARNEITKKGEAWQEYYLCQWKFWCDSVGPVSINWTIFIHVYTHIVNPLPWWPFSVFAGFIRNSNILTINESYLAYLHEFLVPAVGNNSHWLLCYRASLHGWEGEDFHTRCDGKKYTVTVIKKNQYVFGGYTDVPWGK